VTYCRKATGPNVGNPGERPRGLPQRWVLPAPRFLLAFLRAGEEDRATCEECALIAYS
jgi:hypothetical protein